MSSLQDHILSKHSDNSGSIFELLKMDQQLLNSVLTNQATQLQRLDSIANNQMGLSKDMTEIKQKSLSSPPSLPSHLSTSTPAGPVVLTARTDAAPPDPSYSPTAAGQRLGSGKLLLPPRPDEGGGTSS